MKPVNSISCFLALGLGVASLSAQDTNLSQQVELLKKQLEASQESFNQILQQHQQTIESLSRQIEALQKQAQGAQTAAPKPPPPKEADPAPSESWRAKDTPAKEPWSPTAPITLLGGGKNYLNLSFDALFAAGTSTAEDVGKLQLGGHDPVQRGFTVQNLELILSGNVDPYFRGEASLVGHIGADGEFHFEAEEAYLETLSLPGNLQLRAGQFLTEFGRKNASHPHAWHFVDLPLVNARFLGAEGLRNPGARLSWLVPTPFYSELLLAVQNSWGETAYSFRGEAGHSHEGGEHSRLFGREVVDRRTKTLGAMLFAPRYVASFDLSDTQTLLLGTSAAFGPNNSGADTATQIYGVDLYWKWKPANHHGGFPFLSWQTEAMMRRYQAGAFAEDEDGDGVLDIDLPRERLRDYGFYSEIAWGFRRNWVGAFRGDFVTSDRGAFYPDPDRDTRWRLSPNLTWYPTEFSKIRLQYNYDDRRNIGTDHSIWLQLEFMLGSHAAHKF